MHQATTEISSQKLSSHIPFRYRDHLGLPRQNLTAIGLSAHNGTMVTTTFSRTENASWNVSYRLAADRLFTLVRSFLALFL
jgi:hypothetical protein